MNFTDQHQQPLLEDAQGHAQPLASASHITLASVDTLVDVYKVLVALALTNGAYIFVTNGGSSYVLRPWSSYTVFDIAAFLVFVATLVVFAHINILVVWQSYAEGFTNKRLMPLVDYSLLLLSGGIFYVLSHTLAEIDQQPYNFFYVLGGLLLLDIVWTLLSFVFEHKRAILLFYTGLNGFTVGLAVLCLVARISYLPAVLLGLAIVRLLLDIAVSYNTMFPGAFHRQTETEAAPMLRQVATPIATPVEAPIERRTLN